MNPLRQLAEFGQAVWVDNLQRSYITQGTLKKLIDEDGLKGLTSNPTIFQKAVSGSEDYADLFAEARAKGLSANDVYEHLAVRDVQGAADILRPVYDSLKGKDGLASLEVSPRLANQTQATLEEARRLWKTLARPNVMIKVPGTEAGVPAFQQLISEGININVTLLFSQERYRQIADAYLSGLEKFAKAGGDLSTVASVASFFVSRIDVAADKEIEQRLKGAGVSAEQRKTLEALRGSGKVAIANAKLAYRIYQEVFSGARWKALAAKGARVQRVLWASTSTKNPKLRDVLYVEELIGPDTVNTMPPATIDAFREHGKVRTSLVEDLAGAKETMRLLEASGVSMKSITERLAVDGVKLFEESFDALLGAVGEQLKKK
ncbi:transaldolase [Myxococcus sp. AM011]|uniref:transaldolase n=1 Tax=Myxococcus sp. AM011 TaxID=2745200 RepID=UPI00159562A6|nr:transaldolase [Myxococcus sp. AM011]NVJ20845.1 transaldolase [Myxococcus sp. AM011]